MKTKFPIYAILSVAMAFSAPKANAQTIGVTATPKLIQFWDFNQFHPITITAGDSVGTAFSYANTEATDSTTDTWPLNAAYSAKGLTAGHIVYSRPHTIQIGASLRDSIVDEGAGGAFIYDYSSSKYTYFTKSDTENAIGNGFIRIRNPSDSGMLYLHIPTTGYKNISMQYAISTSSASSAEYNVLSYSINNGSTWKNLTKAMDTFNISGVYRPDTLQVENPVTANSGWYPVQINFTSDTTVNNNADFILRFMPTGPNSLISSHNNRYDNIAVWGDTLSASLGINEVPAQAAGYKAYPIPATNFVNIVSAQYTGNKVITLYNVVGQIISVTESQDMQTTINTSSLNAGVYFVEIKEVSTGNTYTIKVVKE